MPIKAYNTRLLVDEFDFSGDTKGVTLSFAVSTLEANTLQSAAAKRIAGPVDGTLECQGYWAGGDAGLLDNEVYDRLGSETGCVVSVLFDTRAVGNPGYTQRTTWGQQMKIDSPVDNLITLDSTWQDNTDRGYFVADGVVDATGGQTVVDFLAAGTLGGWAVLHVTAITGTATGAEFDVESSTTNFGTATTHGTFTVSDTGGYLLTWTGDSVGRYVRLNCTDLGGATDITVHAIVGVTGVTG
jgi:hypothetical protein